MKEVKRSVNNVCIENKIDVLHMLVQNYLSTGDGYYVDWADWM